MQRKTPPPSRPLLVAWAPFSPTLVEVGSLEGGRVVFLSILFGKKLAAPLRYALLALRTLALLGAERPKIVLAQNPPIFLPLLLVLAKRRGRKMGGFWARTIFGLSAPKNPPIFLPLLLVLAKRFYKFKLVEAFGQNQKKRKKDGRVLGSRKTEDSSRPEPSHLSSSAFG